MCEGPRIAIKGELADRWRDALQAASERLLTRRDLDQCARVELRSNLEELEVRVKLADGRTTYRALRDPDALGPTLDALLVVPPVLAAQSSHSLPEFGAPIPAHVSEPTRRAHFEAGFGAMGRLAAAPLYAGIGVAGFAQLDLEPWLVGVTARWDVTDGLVTVASPSGFNMQTLGLGVVVGRRSSLLGAELDTLVGPEILAENQEADGDSAQPDGAGGGGTDFRLDLAVRLSTKTSGFHFFAQADLDLSPSRLRRTKQLDPLLPPLPSWSLGLVLGAASRSP
ncbi:MAG: hypothetical protein ABI627_07610 [Polyangiaceae bacterium]